MPARSSEGRREHKPARWGELAWNHRLVVFACCLFLFQFANASMLPLAGERLNHRHQHESELLIAAMIVVQQVITALIAAWVARKADEWGRKKLLIAGFAALLPRALLFAPVVFGRRAGARQYHSGYHRHHDAAGGGRCHPQERALAQPGVIALFLAAQAESGLTPPTLGRRLAAIGFMHRRAGLPPPQFQNCAGVLGEVLAGIRRSHGVAPAKKSAADAEILRASLDTLPGDMLPNTEGV